MDIVDITPINLDDVAAEWKHEDITTSTLITSTSMTSQPDGARGHHHINIDNIKLSNLAVGWSTKTCLLYTSDAADDTPC
eukprot:6462383-Amphidinium_carterae.1